MPTTFAQPNLRVGERGTGYCPLCTTHREYIGRHVTVGMPPAPFVVAGVGGVCTECSALMAVTRMVFEVLLTAWQNRPSAETHIVCAVRQPGESTVAYRTRLVTDAEMPGTLAAVLELADDATVGDDARASEDVVAEVLAVAASVRAAEAPRVGERPPHREPPKAAAFRRVPKIIQ